MRLLFAIATAAASAVLAAVILGEYELRGVTAVVAGVMLALVIGEVAVVVAGRRDLVLAASCAVVVGLSVVWAAWIYSAHDWSFVPAGAWFGAVLGAATAMAWVSPRRGLRGSVPPEADSPPAP